LDSKLVYGKPLKNLTLIHKTSPPVQIHRSIFFHKRAPPLMNVFLGTYHVPMRSYYNKRHAFVNRVGNFFLKIFIFVIYQKILKKKLKKA